ncbi:hypothetical protein MRX96_014729 [Rhipicephalus microplus]
MYRKAFRANASRRQAFTGRSTKIDDQDSTATFRGPVSVLVGLDKTFRTVTAMSDATLTTSSQRCASLHGHFLESRQHRSYSGQ